MQVLLSCSHSFHTTCLESFERFAQARCCPICRATGYQKRHITDGRDAHWRTAATAIQAHWRGYRQRVRFRDWRAQQAPAHPALFQSWVKDRFQWQAGRLHRAMERQSDDLAALFAECEQALTSTKPVFSQAATAMAARLSSSASGQQLQPHGQLSAELHQGPMLVDSAASATLPTGQVVVWSEVLNRLRQREQEGCPICMGALDNGKNAACCLLSCSHCFHLKCVEALERFEDAAKDSSKRVCPVCRATYVRTEIQL